MLPSPIVIHVLRPYATEEEYLACERSSIGAKSMLLIDQPPLPVETPVVFDVTLLNGQKPIRAEGVVLGHVAPEGDNPGGLRVRFKRFGAATKAFVERARSASAVASASSAGMPAVEITAATLSLTPPAPEPTREGAPPGESAPPSESALPAPKPQESSGVHRKVVSPVAAPADREALLSRLRSRRAS